MGKFNQMMLRDSDGVMNSRSERIVKIAKMGQETLVQQIEKDLMVLQDKQDAMVDLSPDNRFSLKPGEDFNVESWVSNYQDISVSIANKKIEQKIASENLADLFGSSTDGESTAADV